MAVDYSRNSYQASVRKSMCHRTCRYLSGTAGCDVICPFPYELESAILFGSGCPTYCDVTSIIRCTDCAYMQKVHTDGCSGSCMMWHGNPGGKAGNHCPHFVRREGEDAGEFIERMTVELGGTPVADEDGYTQETDATRNARADARQMWFKTHEMWERQFQDGYVETFRPNQNVSKEDALKVKDYIDRIIEDVDWRDCRSTAKYIKAAKNVAENVFYPRR